MKRFERPLILLVVALVGAAALGLLANLADFDPLVLSALIGAGIALLVAFGMPYAFGDLIRTQHGDRVQADEATVVADDQNHREAVPNGQGISLANGLQQSLLRSDAPIESTAGRTVSVASTLPVEIRDEFRDIGHGGIIPLREVLAAAGNGSPE